VRYATGEAKEPLLRPTFDRRIKLEFHGARITTDCGLLAYRELDDALGLADIAITKLLDGRRGKNTRHKLSGLSRQAVFGRLAGYEDVNDAERAIVGREGLDRAAASSSQMGRFETEWLATNANLEALTDLSRTWIDGVHARKPPEGSLANRFGTADHQHPEPANGESRLQQRHARPELNPAEALAPDGAHTRGAHHVSEVARASR
jgi:Transposase DDE domain group 1